MFNKLYCTVFNVLKPPKVRIVHGSNGSKVVPAVQEGLDDRSGGRELGDDQEGVRVLGTRHVLENKIRAHQILVKIKKNTFIDVDPTCSHLRDDLMSSGTFKRISSPKL